MTLVRGSVVIAALLASASCSSASAKPAAPVGSTTSAAGKVTHVDFADAQFSASTCPKDHALANCFSGAGSATLSGVGRVTIARTVVSGDQKRGAPDGCDPADTTGVLKDARGGSARISGTGTLCGLLAKYTLLVDGGTGSLAGLHITGSITNNGGAESWDVTNLVAP
jgi:hypothetical protein